MAATRPTLASSPNKPPAPSTGKPCSARAEKRPTAPDELGHHPGRTPGSPTLVVRNGGLRSGTVLATVGSMGARGIQSLALQGNAFQRGEIVGGAGQSEQPCINEILALAVDVALLPANVDMALLEASAKVLRARSSSDDLRLPPPPVRAPDGRALFGSLSRTLQTFFRTGTEPVAAAADAVVAEARMMALLKPIHELETEIRGHMASAC